MFDSEIGQDASMKHHLSQHNLILNGHNSSVTVPTHKILPIKKVARVAKTAASIPQEEHATPTSNGNAKAVRNINCLKLKISREKTLTHSYENEGS